METVQEQRADTTSSMERNQRITGGGVESPHITKLSREDAIRELEALRQRGLYKGPGSIPAERTQALRPEQYVREDAPVLEERIRSREIHEVIPQVRREREIAEIRHAVLPIREHIREDRTYSERELEEIRQQEYRSGISESERHKNDSLIGRLSKGYQDVQATQHEYVYRKPLVDEIVKPRIIHEVHPVLQREVEKEHYEREILPIRERIIDGPRVSDEIEMLRPIDRSNWTATHGRDIYDKEGWRYGETNALIQGEPSLRDMFTPPGMARRTSSIQRQTYDNRVTERMPSTQRQNYDNRRTERMPITQRQSYDNRGTSRIEGDYDGKQYQRRGGYRGKDHELKLGQVYDKQGYHQDYASMSPQIFEKRSVDRRNRAPIFERQSNNPKYYSSSSRQSSDRYRQTGRPVSPQSSVSSYSSDDDEDRRRYRSYRQPGVNDSRRGPGRYDGTDQNVGTRRRSFFS